MGILEETAWAELPLVTIVSGYPDLEGGRRWCPRFWRSRPLAQNLQQVDLGFQDSPTCRIPGRTALRALREHVAAHPLLPLKALHPQRILYLSLLHALFPDNLTTMFKTRLRRGCPE
eukprot:2403307-Pyramimonas_sp.AAC.1